MADYPHLYSVLFNAITDAVEELGKGNYEYAAVILRNAQRQTEELYIEGDDNGGDPPKIIDFRELFRRAHPEAENPEQD